MGCGGLGHLGESAWTSHTWQGVDTVDVAIQYAKSMGLKTIGMDISNSQLQAVKELGADIVINTLDEPDFGTKVKKLTKGGCHAAAVFSASNIAYESAPKTLRYVRLLAAYVAAEKEDFHANISTCRIHGLLMVAGIPKKALTINALDILLGKYRIAGKSSGVPQNMPEAIEFSHKHNIKSHITTFDNIQDIHKAIDMMNSGQSAGRFGIVFE